MAAKFLQDNVRQILLNYSSFIIIINIIIIHLFKKTEQLNRCAKNLMKSI